MGSSTTHTLPSNMSDSSKGIENTTYFLIFLSEKKRCFGQTMRQGQKILCLCLPFSLCIILSRNWNIRCHGSPPAETPLLCNKCREIHISAVNNTRNTASMSFECLPKSCQQAFKGLCWISSAQTHFFFSLYQVLAYCSDTEDLAQLESDGTWYKNLHR